MGPCQQGFKGYCILNRAGQGLYLILNPHGEGGRCAWSGGGIKGTPAMGASVAHVSASVKRASVIAETPLYLTRCCGAGGPGHPAERLLVIQVFAMIASVVKHSIANSLMLRPD
jgi:hypothetical protein